MPLNQINSERLTRYMPRSTKANATERLNRCTVHHNQSPTLKWLILGLAYMLAGHPLQ